MHDNDKAEIAWKWLYRSLFDRIETIADDPTGDLSAVLRDIESIVFAMNVISQDFKILFKDIERTLSEKELAHYKEISQKLADNKQIDNDTFMQVVSVISQHTSGMFE